MKKLIFFFSIILFSQLGQSQQHKNSYEVLWRKVENFEIDQLPKSALELVNAISNKAKKEKNNPQIVKALLYASKFALTLEEDAQLKIINDFQLEIKNADFPTKNVLESYLASLYWQYFQQNRYQFYNRTNTDIKVDSTDFRTWDLTTLFNEINSRFDASLMRETELQQIKISDFEIILNKRADSEKYRPSLFDILAHNALSFYRSDEHTINRPADKFEINDPEMLCEAYQFTSKKIETVDKTSKQVKALLIYQQLLKFHLKDTAFDAYVEVDIERLKYVRNHAVFADKEEQYLEALQNTAEGLKQNKYAALYTYEIALLYQKWGQTYQPNSNEEYRWKLKEALNTCEVVIEEHPKSRGAEKCTALKAQILQKALQLTTENNIPINTVSRLLVSYKNHDSLKLSAHSISKRQLKALEKLYKKEEKLAFLKKLAVTKKWTATLKNENDYQSHGTEITMPPLPNGTYIILAEPTNENNTFAFSQLQVTDLAITEIQDQNNQIYQVVNRNNGKPIAGAQMNISYVKNYNRILHSITKTTDNLGRVLLDKKAASWSQIQIEVSHQDDTALFGNYYIYKKNAPLKEKVTSKAFVFMDRSIYRPGQTLYFKGILVETFKDQSSLMTDEPVYVTLYDANNQEVSKLEFKSNDYGSFSGEFIVPSNGLTGQFHIGINTDSSLIYDQHYFSVEEYKRPKFETSFEPITETYKINDSIRVRGSATAYAGSAITDAKVSYRVKRNVQYPRWYYWYRPYFNSEAQEITHGETTTDASGNYLINFKALPDTSVDKKDLPIFKYEVTADVTDINGETHSTSSLVSVGYHALTASIEIAENIEKNAQTNSLNIATSNLNGEHIDTKGSLKMYKLKSPENTLRARPWPAPDYAGFSKAKFKQHYPHDAYTNEDNPLNWEKGELVWQADFDTGKAKEISLGKIKTWASGKYLVELLTKDKFGQLVKDIAHTTLMSSKDKQLADNQLFYIKSDKDNYMVGDVATITLATSTEDLNVMLFVEKDSEIIDSRLIRLNQNSKKFSIPVTSNDVGGFAITYSFTTFNSFQSGNINISVPYLKTDLEIETSTFRDKLQPGTNETWAFKIKGPKGEKVAAELLANMYDASLDAFKNHSWNFNPLNKQGYTSFLNCSANNSFGVSSFNTFMDNQSHSYEMRYFDSLNWFGLYFGNNIRIRGYSNRMMSKEVAPSGDQIANRRSFDDDMVEMEESDIRISASAPIEKTKVETKNQLDKQKPENHEGASDAIVIRKNLQENAFFFPQLKTDKDGNISFNFTTPEALTKWNVQLLAHTKNLESSVLNLQTVTQKELMVTPNAPRFLREGDKIVISTKIANLTEKALSGQAKLELVDALTGKDISKKLLFSMPSGELSQAEAAFEVDSLGNTQASWTLSVPDGIQAVQYTVLAKAGEFSDGEQNMLPVLTNRILVTETMPMWVHSNQTKTFTLDKLKTTQSSTLKHHKLTLEMTSNPAWYAVQALPYLMEYPYECNEQTFSKYYANSLATHIANSNPRIQEVFKQWANSDDLVSNLEKNQELKSLLIQETPWLRDAQSETEQKKRIALLFNLNKMKNEQAIALNKLAQNQKGSGAWPWFKGGPDSRYITQHIITGLGHLKQLSVTSNEVEMQNMIQSAIKYLDNEFVKEYNQMKKFSKNLNDDHLSRTQIHYLYMRSFFKDIKTYKKVDEITSYYKGQAQKYWKSKNLYSNGMLALIMHRMNDDKTSNKILRALEENSITSEELGMYWKENTSSWYWYQAPIETQALLIEAFSEIKPEDISTIDNLKIWLLKNKQTNQWKTTKATTEAIYALLLQGSDWLSITDAVDVLVGGEKIEPSKLENVKVEAGTGYYKTAWNGAAITPKMAEIQISKKGEGIAWGALYWQYFEDLDKITSAETPLKLQKKLFLKKNTDTGEEISEITDKTDLKVGDLVRVRIELRADRQMEFVHMKDMRAAGFEPINIISKYKWQDGLGYYEATKDASTNFFFDYLPKGVYVFEYDLRVNNAGDFSNGITTIQSMYAPEFSSHSEGVRVKVN